MEHQDSQAAIKDAVASGDSAILKSLVSQWQANQSENAMMGTRFQDSLREAIKRHDAASVTILVKAGCTVDQGIMDSILKHTSQTGDTSLLQAVLDGGFDINTNFSGHTGDSLIMAIVYKSDPAVALLLSHGADPNLNRRAESDTALEVAAKIAPPSIVKLLLQHGGQTEDRAALHYAATYGRIDVADLLLRHGQDVNVIPGNDDVPAGYLDIGWGTALHEAARADQVEMVRYLVRQGADVHLKDNKGKTPREVALECGNEEIAELL